ncbi:MAG TPA: flagellar biosynthetic protein FliO [Stellaceae bacterium]|nr:flagellar biosynthetic protein FliO [Stellaceae bacterium]
MPVEPEGLASLSLTIGLIVVLLWGAVWAVRRLRPGGGAGGADCAVIRALALGPRERLLVVRVGDKQLVVGVGASAVSLLCELETPLAAGRPPLAPPLTRQDGGGNFAAAIGRAVKSWRDG